MSTSTVANIMTVNPVTIEPTNSIATAIELLRKGGFRRLPVMENNRLVGIVTDRDLRLAANSPVVASEPWYDSFLLQYIDVRSCMTKSPITVTPRTSIIDAARLMIKHKIGGLPVMEGDRLVGIVTETDMLNYLITCLEAQECTPFPGEPP